MANQADIKPSESTNFDRSTIVDYGNVFYSNVHKCGYYNFFFLSKKTF